MKVRVAIDRLVLDGVPLGPADRASLLARVESELARELRAQTGGLPVAGHAAERVTTPAFSLPHGGDVQQLGSEIAAAIHASLGASGQ